MKPIITAVELKDILHQKNLVVLDARTGKNASEDYLHKHLLNARFVDLDKDLANIGEDAAFGGRHPLPTLEKFKKTIQNLGISEDSHIVVYDTSNGANAAARCWWMLKSFGLEKVQVLSGGLQAAEKEGITMTLLQAQGDKAENFDKTTILLGEYWRLPISTLEEVEKGIAESNTTVIDVRDAYRFRGESEPIDLVAGHIPGAINIPFSENLDTSGEFLPPETLKEKYGGFLKGRSQNLIIHCGSGVTACHTILALEYAGYPTPNLYVGSWSEWSRREGKEIAKEI